MRLLHWEQHGAGHHCRSHRHLLRVPGDRSSVSGVDRVLRAAELSGQWGLWTEAVAATRLSQARSELSPRQRLLRPGNLLPGQVRRERLPLQQRWGVRPGLPLPGWTIVTRPSSLPTQWSSPPQPQALESATPPGNDVEAIVASPPVRSPGAIPRGREGLSPAVTTGGVRATRPRRRIALQRHARG
jgi:hypothetical protein